MLWHIDSAFGKAKIATTCKVKMLKTKRTGSSKPQNMKRRAGGVLGVERNYVMYVFTALIQNARGVIV